MDITELLKSLVIYGAIPLAVAWIKGQGDRIKALELLMPTKVDEDRVRQLLSDKLIPIQEDVKGLDQKLDKIMDILLKADK